MKKRRVFIGSSSEYLAEANAIKALLEDGETIEGILWTSVFEPGYLTFEALERMLLECDAAVFLATPDDKSNIRRRDVETPRANIMLEFGLVAGRMGRHNIAVCHFTGVDLPSDLQGLTVINMRRRAHKTTVRPRPGRTRQLTPAESSLVQWSSRLLLTADSIPRTDVVHGYTGRWDFEFDLCYWRRAAVTLPSYVHGNGQIHLYIDAGGTIGNGLLAGTLTFAFYADRPRPAAKGQKANPPRKPSKTPDPIHCGELNFCHEVRSLACDTSGGLKFLSRTVALQKMTTKGQPVGDLRSLENPQQPRPFTWVLKLANEPRTLEGTIDSKTEESNGAEPYTQGQVRLTKVSNCL
jgi:hypothetical protein